MLLRDYLHQQRLSATAAAKAVGVSIPVITRLIRGERGVSLATALRIETWSNGAVTARELTRAANDARKDAEGPSTTDLPF